MMNDSYKTEQEKSILRWGGLAGVLGGICFVLTVIVVAVGPVGMEDPATLDEWVTRFPDIKAARVVENGLYLVALILGVVLFLALYQALRKTSLTPALFGSTLGILGLVVFMAGSLPHVATTPLADLYHAPGATPEEQAALALMWQATWGIFDALLYVGFFVVPIALIALGVAMLGAPAFGKGFGRFSVALGVVGLVAAVLQIADPASDVGALSYFAMVISYFALGYKVYSVSKTL